VKNFRERAAIFLSHVAHERVNAPAEIYLAANHPRPCSRPTAAPRWKLIAASAHVSHGTGRSLLPPPSSLLPLSLSLSLSLSVSLHPCFYLMHKSRKFLAHAPFRPSECGGRARPINHRKTAISAKGGKYVANGAIGNSNSVASDENILWAEERCAVCLTSGPAGSFVRAQCGKRADDHARADNQPRVCVAGWKETGVVGGSL